MNNQQSHTEKFEELCAGYVLHALEEEERREFDEMLAEASEDERILFQQLWTAAHQLAFTIEPQDPSEDLKERLMAQVRAEMEELLIESQKVTPISESEQSDEEEKGFNWTAFSVAASFALLIVSLSLIFYTFNLSSTISDKDSMIKNQEVKITQLQDSLTKKSEMLSILGARDLDLVIMSGLDVNPNGYGKVMWDAEKQQALLQVSNLPAVPSDKDYQLWIIKDNKPVPSGVFAVNQSSGNAFFKIEKMASATRKSANSFAVTLEPKGGSPTGKPTGDMYLLGNNPG